MSCQRKARISPSQRSLAKGIKPTMVQSLRDFDLSAPPLFVGLAEQLETR
jgi:hypothetical protein